MYIGGPVKLTVYWVFSVLFILNTKLPVATDVDRTEFVYCIVELLGILPVSTVFVKSAVVNSPVKFTVYV